MQRRDIDLADLDAVLADIHSLRASGYEKIGQWDLSQICRHCIVPINGCIDGFGFKASPPMRLMARLLMKGPLFRKRRMKTGLPAPDGTVSEPSLDEGEAVALLEQAIERFKVHTGPLQDNPFLGAMPAAQWHEFLTIHTMHHLSFLAPK